jgi:hypothetical protein
VTVPSALARRLAAVALVLLVVLAAAGCGSSNSSTTSGGGGSSTSSRPKIHFAKTKFVLHAGLAFGAFHRYIYKPLRSGTLKGSSAGHKAVVATKAGLAGLFAYHELKIALQDARADPALSRLVAPLDALAARLQSVGASLKRGNVDAAGIQAANGQVAGLAQQSARAGATVRDIKPPASLPAGG